MPSYVAHCLHYPFFGQESSFLMTERYTQLQLFKKVLADELNHFRSGMKNFIKLYFRLALLLFCLANILREHSFFCSNFQPNLQNHFGLVFKKWFVVLMSRPPSISDSDNLFVYFTAFSSNKFSKCLINLLFLQ